MKSKIDLVLKKDAEVCDGCEISEGAGFGNLQSLLFYVRLSKWERRWR